MPVLARIAHREPAAFRTIFSTRHRYDAGVAGYDCATDPDQGGFEVHFDGRDSIPSVIMNGSDGQIEVCGLAAMEALSDALLDAVRLARRQVGQ